MNTDLPSPEQLKAMGPRAAATLWLERLQRDPSTDDDAAFQTWLASDDANRRAWERAKDLWDVFEEPDNDSAFADLRREALSMRGRPAPTPAVWYLAAASIAAAVIGGVMVSSFGRETPQQPVQVASASQRDLHGFKGADYETGAAQRLNVRLEDGTRLALEPNTAVDVAYVDGQRLVRLTRGEAQFDVTHDEAHPFRVAAGGRVVSDLGTRFNIRLQGDETRVRLVEGSLGVTVGDDARRAVGPAKILVPGQELIARAGQPDEVVQTRAAPAAEGQLEVIQFDNTPLSDAVAQINRYSDKKLVIVDPKVAALRVSGAFRTNDPTSFAETLTALYPVRLVALPDGRTEIAPRRGGRR